MALVPALWDGMPKRSVALIGSMAYPFVAFWLIWGGLGLEPVSSTKLGGLLLTMIIGVSGISFSLPIGIVLALSRSSNLPIVKSLAVIFIEFIRGVPLITLLFVAHVLLNYFLPKGVNFDIVLRVVIMVTLFASAYMAEVIRGGLAALPKGQYEAADALGLGYWQSMRLIILPQAMKISIPGIVNTFIGLFKDTTLVLIIGSWILSDWLRQHWLINAGMVFMWNFMRLSRSCSLSSALQCPDIQCIWNANCIPATASRLVRA